MTTKTLLPTLLATLLLAPPAGAMVFLKVDGIEDVSAVPGREDWMPVLDFSLGVERRAPTGPLATSTRRALPTVVIKGLDAASPKLAEFLGTNASIPKITLEVHQENGDGTTGPVFCVELEEVTVTSWEVQQGGAIEGGGEPDALVYEKVTWTYQSMTITHVASGTTATIDLIQN